MCKGRIGQFQGPEQIGQFQGPDESASSMGQTEAASSMGQDDCFGARFKGLQNFNLVYKT